MKKFIKELNKAYKNTILEQGPGPAMGGLGGEPAPGGMSAPPPAAAPTPAPAAPPQSIPGEETSIEDNKERSSSDVLLISMIAKALLINIDDDDKIKVIKYLKSLDKKNASEIEESIVNMINTYDYQNLDEDLDKDFKISHKKSRKVLKFLDKIMSDYVDTGVSDSKEA
jgi:hypothetical protein